MVQDSPTNSSNPDNSQNLSTFVAAEYDWLALRYKLDCRSRNPELERKFTDKMSKIDNPAILDLGSGFGTNLLRLASLIPNSQTWTMLDRDQGLIQRIDSHYEKISSDPFYGIKELSPGKVRFLNSSAEFTGLTENFLNPKCSIWTQKFDAVVANAVFDLLSLDQIKQFIELAKTNWGENQPLLYFTINLDKGITISPSDLDDSEFLSIFHEHMNREQSFGRSVGAKSAIEMTRTLADHGFLVDSLPSDWKISSEETDLLTANFDFIEDASMSLLKSVGTSEGHIDRCRMWIEEKRKKINSKEIDLTITHKDILAIFSVD